MVLSFGQNISLMVGITYATILLSSQIFISLGDAIVVMARFISGVLVCRWIVVFELRGMREVTSQDSSSLSRVVETTSQSGRETHLPRGEIHIYQKVAT